MISTIKEVADFQKKRLKDHIEEDYVKIVNPTNSISLTVKMSRFQELQVIENVIKTRAHKDNDSIYVSAPSREIKKWFETRRF